MRAEEHAGRRHGRPCPARPGADQLPEAAIALPAGELEPGPGPVHQRAQVRALHVAREVDQLDARCGSLFEQWHQGPGVDHREAEQRVVDAGVLQLEYDLQDQAPLGGESDEPAEVGVGEIEGLVTGEQAHAGHPVLLVAAAQVLLPIGPREVHAAERA